MEVINLGCGSLKYCVEICQSRGYMGLVRLDSVSFQC